jgi:hypothetical protein
MISIMTASVFRCGRCAGVVGLQQGHRAGPLVLARAIERAVVGQRAEEKTAVVEVMELAVRIGRASVGRKVRVSFFGLSAGSVIRTLSS